MVTVISASCVPSISIGWGNGFCQNKSSLVQNPASYPGYSQYCFFNMTMKIKPQFKIRRHRDCLTTRLILFSCTSSQEPIQKTQQCSTAKQRFVKKGVQWLFPLCTGTPGHKHQIESLDNIFVIAMLLKDGSYRFWIS